MVVTAPPAEQIIERLKDEEVVFMPASLDEYLTIFSFQCRIFATKWL